MRKTAFLSSLLCFSLLGAGGCEKASDPAPNLDPANFENVGEVGRVEVLDTGASPKRELRFLFAEGSSERAKMVVQMDANTKVQGQSVNVDMGMNFTMRASIEGAPSPEKASMSLLIEGFSLDENETSPMLMQAKDLMKEMIEGMKGHMTLDHRGQIIDVGYDMSSVPAEMRESLSQLEDSLKGMTTSLPKEAVGVGAKWRLYQTLESNGIKIRQRIDLTLEKLDGAMVHLSMVVAQQADAQQANMPSLPAGASARVKSLGSTGTGTMVLDLKGLVPYSSEMNLKTTAKFNLDLGGGSSAMTMRAKTKIKVQRLDN